MRSEDGKRSMMTARKAVDRDVPDVATQRLLLAFADRMRAHPLVEATSPRIGKSVSATAMNSAARELPRELARLYGALNGFKFAWRLKDGSASGAVEFPTLKESEALHEKGGLGLEPDLAESGWALDLCPSSPSVLFVAVDGVCLLDDDGDVEPAAKEIAHYFAAGLDCLFLEGWLESLSDKRGDDIESRINAVRAVLGLPPLD
jgi:hypothetical protein